MIEEAKKRREEIRSQRASKLKKISKLFVIAWKLVNGKTKSENFNISKSLNDFYKTKKKKITKKFFH